MSDPSANYRFPRVAGEQAARALRLEVELGFAPIGGPHLWALVAQRGADLAFHDFGKDGGDGLYLWNGDRGLIVLNANDGRKPTRLRFTAAHELGHHEMHRHSLPSVILSDNDILQEQTAIEKEANSFAAELLAPAAALRREFAGKEPDSVTPIDVVQLMRTYGLSYAAMLWRLVNSGIISMGVRNRLDDESQGRIHQIERALGFDEKQLFGPPSEELPEEFVLSTLHAFREGAIDEDRLAAFLRRDRRKAVSLAGEIEPAVSGDTAAIDELLGV